MKFNQLLAVGVGLAISGVAFADPIEGNWQMSEGGKPKAVVTISKSGNAYVGKVTSGQTDKAKTYVGKQVLFNVTSQGDGKYKGKAKDPRWGVIPAVNADITLNGNKLTLKTLKGSQTWTKK